MTLHVVSDHIFKLAPWPGEKLTQTVGEHVGKKQIESQRDEDLGSLEVQVCCGRFFTSWTDPFETYAQVKLDHETPRDRGEHKQTFETNT